METLNLNAYSILALLIAWLPGSRLAGHLAGALASMATGDGRRWRLATESLLAQLNTEERADFQALTTAEVAKRARRARRAAAAERIKRAQWAAEGSALKWSRALGESALGLLPARPSRAQTLAWAALAGAVQTGNDARELDRLRLRFLATVRPSYGLRGHCAPAPVAWFAARPSAPDGTFGAEGRQHRPTEDHDAHVACWAWAQGAAAHPSEGDRLARNRVALALLDGPRRFTHLPSDQIPASVGRILAPAHTAPVVLLPPVVHPLRAKYLALVAKYRAEMDCSKSCTAHCVARATWLAGADPAPVGPAPAPAPAPTEAQAQARATWAASGAALAWCRTLGESALALAPGARGLTPTQRRAWQSLAGACESNSEPEITRYTRAFLAQLRPALRAAMPYSGTALLPSGPAPRCPGLPFGPAPRPARGPRLVRRHNPRLRRPAPRPALRPYALAPTTLGPAPVQHDAHVRGWRAFHADCATADTAHCVARALYLARALPPAPALRRFAPRPAPADQARLANLDRARPALARLARDITRNSANLADLPLDMARTRGALRASTLALRASLARLQAESASPDDLALSVPAALGRAMVLTRGTPASAQVHRLAGLYCQGSMPDLAVARALVALCPTL